MTSPLERLQDGAQILCHVAGWDSSLGEDHLGISTESRELTSSQQGVSNNIVKIAECRTFNMIPVSRWPNGTHHIKILQGERIKQ
jgi:hypothetical protein